MKKKKRIASMPNTESHLQFISKINSQFFVHLKIVWWNTNTQKTMRWKNKIDMKKHYEINSVCMFTNKKLNCSLHIRYEPVNYGASLCGLFLFLFLHFHFTLHLFHSTFYILHSEREKELEWEHTLPVLSHARARSHSHLLKLKNELMKWWLHTLSI